jgi:hypothetical protein
MPWLLVLSLFCSGKPPHRPNGSGDPSPRPRPEADALGKKGTPSLRPEGPRELGGHLKKSPNDGFATGCPGALFCPGKPPHRPNGSGDPSPGPRPKADALERRAPPLCGLKGRENLHAPPTPGQRSRDLTGRTALSSLHPGHRPAASVKRAWLLFLATVHERSSGEPTQRAPAAIRCLNLGDLQECPGSLFCRSLLAAPLLLIRFLSYPS